MNSFLRKCFHQSLPYLLLICPFLLLGQGKLTIYAQGVKWHREVPREIDPESVIALNWTRFKLKQISDSILKFKNLEYLDISWNPNLDHTQAIEVISKLQKLKGVSFEFNELNDIPNEVLLLKQLKWLSFNNNKLKKVNPCLTELTSLEVLVLGYKGSRIDIGNKIEEIPEEFHDLKELKELRLGSNKLTEFPLSICHLGKLEKLYLLSNEISFIPKCVANLKNLQLIYLTNNKIKEVPDFLYDMPSLEHIYVD